MTRFFAVVLIFCCLLITIELKVDAGLNETPPNVIIVLTDDQDVVLNGMVKLFFIDLYAEICH